MDTVQSHHTVEDIRTIRSVLNKAELLVRINPMHDASFDYGSSEEEIDSVIHAAAPNGTGLCFLAFFAQAL